MEVINREVVVATPGPADTHFYMAALDPEAKRGGIARMHQHGPTPTFDVFTSTSNTRQYWLSNMYDQLLVSDMRRPDTPIVPDIAYAWEVSDDLSKYTFHIREGVKFHNGSDLNSADVHASIIRAIDPENYREGLSSNIGPTLVSGGLTAAGLSTPDEYTVVAEIPKDDVRGLSWMMTGFGSQYLKIADDEVLKEVKGYFGDVSPIDGGNSGSGPYKMTEITDDHVLVEAHTDYWNPNAPYLDGIEFIWGKNFTPQLTASLVTGQIDWGYFMNATDSTDPNSPLVTNPEINIGFHILPFGSGTALNNASGPVSDKRVRKAIALAFDQSAMRKVVAPFIGTEHDGGWWPFVPGTYGITEAQMANEKYFRSPTPEDLAEAKQLLAEAGYASGADVPTLTIIVQDDAALKALTEAYQAMLKQNLGVDSVIEVNEIGVYMQRYRDLDFDIGAEWYIPMANPYPEEWLSYTYGQCDGKPCTGNRGASNIPRFDELIEELAGTTGDPAKRLEVSKELYDLLNDEMPAIPYQTGLISYVAWWDHLKGFQCDECTFGGQYKGAKWDYVWLDR